MSNKSERNQIISTTSLTDQELKKVVRGHDTISVHVNDRAQQSLTDVLKRVATKTLERNRSLLDTNKEISSITLTVKLDKDQTPYKVFLNPTHESRP